MRKILIFTLLAMLFVFSSVQTTFAVQKVVSESDHLISTSDVKARIVEEYTQGVTIYPGASVDKVVNVKNTGDSDIVVRVKIEKAWGETRGDDGKVIPDPSLSTDNILIDYNSESWVYDPDDGYYYYKGILKPGETTLEPLLNEFTIDKDTGNEYAGMQADIIVKMECVQAAANGIGIWNKSFADLGIVVSPSALSTSQNMTTVTFVNETSGFAFEPANTDLFANFKGLLPGETRSQDIQVKNTYNNQKGTEIFLHAEDITQSRATPETLALVNKLLQEYVTIVVTDESGKVIYSGPIWGEPYSSASNPASMHNDISLGVFASGKSEILNVQLRVDPAMDNQYQELLGLIKWVWSASPIPNPPPPPPPITSPGTITISGEKFWNHGDNPESKWPTSITLYIKADGEIILQKQITAANHWQWTIVVDKYAADGHAIVYSVDEATVNNYSKTISGYNITNVFQPGTDTNQPPPKLPVIPTLHIPRTGDTFNLVLWSSLTLLSLAAMLFMAVHTVRQRRKRKAALTN